MDAQKIEFFSWTRDGMESEEDGNYVHAGDFLQTLASKEAELVKLRADILPLQEFADAVFGEFPDHGDIDGFDLQDIAEACGLLKKESTVVPCGEACQCAEIGKPDGAASECYRVQPVMRRARIASARHSATTQPPKEPT